MTTLNNLTAQMNNLEIEIARQQAYLAKFEDKNNAGEYDVQWEQYKEEAQYNLNKWDALKVMRDNLKTMAA